MQRFRFPVRGTAIRWLALVLLMAHRLPAQIPAPLSAEIDPFIGTVGGGNTFPGPSRPFGMIKPGPDVGKNDANAGWAADGDINGFSQTHVSGTGGGCKYGNVLVQPTVGEPVASGYGSPRANESAAAGYYRVRLARYGIDVEISAATRAAIYRFVYPETRQANLLFDAGHCLSSLARLGEGQTITDSTVTVLSPTEVGGSSSVTGGWNKQTNSYTVFFYAITDKAAQTWGTWADGILHPRNTAEPPTKTKTGAWLSFATHAGEAVHLRMGISFVSVAQAKQNIAREIPGVDFDGVRAAAAFAWDGVLDPLTVPGAFPDTRRMFYTALYHSMLMPVDRTGENPLFLSDEPYYDDFFTVWDTFRTSGPLLTLVAPQRQADTLRALIDIYRHEGWLPEGRSGNFNGRVQGGSNTDMLLADAFVKNLPGIDWPTAYEAVVKDAEIPPVDQVKEGRGGLEDWHRLGYVSLEGVDRPGSKQMEYAANDAAVATLARGLGRAEDAAKYARRAANWQNLWDADFEEGGFKGFIRPRHRDGSWLTPFDAMMHCSWNGKTFYEGNSWTYSFYVPHDMPALVERCGGAERFTQRLDAFFAGPGRFDVSDEPGFLIPYLYHYSGHPERTAERVRQIIAENYHASRNGLPGNDDSGAMSSLYVWNVIGLFPIAGQDLYLIGSPTVPEAVFKLANGKTFTVEARDTSPANKYVVAAALNGQPLRTAWIRHADVLGGGTLVLDMAAKPAGWSKDASPPTPK